MPKDMRVLGCSFDGLKDHVTIDGSTTRCWGEERLRPAEIVLPAQAQGKFRSGTDAKRSRIASGIGWPPEASIDVRAGSRRVPVSMAWRALIDARDRMSYWSTGNGLSFSVPSIISRHALDLLRAANADPQQDRVILAIPNDLDETGQEGLIREIQGFGFANIELIWRPVAAALAWLNCVQEQILDDRKDGDALVVVHVGIDAIEFVSFRLRERSTIDGRRFIVPLRDVPRRQVRMCGCDWAFGLIDKAMSGTAELGAAWQIFSSYPEVWDTLAQTASPSGSPPRVWHRNGSWRLWEPDAKLGEVMWKIPARVPQLFLEWYTACCHLERKSPLMSQSWRGFLQDGVQKTVEQVEGRVRGLILSGPITSSDPSAWLSPIDGLLREKGLKPVILPDPTVGALWVPGNERDAVSEGASIYGHRRRKDEPTYLDTLPPLDLLAGQRGHYEWRSLVDAKECEGGKPYVNELPGKFNLPRRSRRLAIYLRKGGENAFRKATINFPNAPEEDVPLDTIVTMTPASGRAQVELRPVTSEFLGGRRVFLDYSQMEEVTEARLPSSQRGWPLTVKIRIDERSVWLSSAHIWGFSDFLKLDFSNSNYCDFLGYFKKAIKRRSRMPEKGRFIYLPIIDQDGRAGIPEAQALIDRVTLKLGEDLNQILNNRSRLPYDRLRAVEHIRQAATWFYAAAPSQVISHLLKELNRKLVSSNDVFGAAGRAFTKKEDMSTLYMAIERRLNTAANTVRFPIDALQAITNLLTYRETAPDAMTSSQARRFIAEARDTMQDHTEAQRFKRKFFQAVQLFICLLRFRIIERNFLSLENPQDEGLFKDIKKCLEAARLQLPKKTAEIIEEVEKYMEFKGTEPDILKTIIEHT